MSGDALGESLYASTYRSSRDDAAYSFARDGGSHHRCPSRGADAGPSDANVLAIDGSHFSVSHDGSDDKRTHLVAHCSYEGQCHCCIS